MFLIFKISMSRKYLEISNVFEFTHKLRIFISEM